MTRETGTWGSARAIALTVLAAPFLLSACLGGATSSQKPVKFTPASEAGTYPTRPAPAKIVNADHFAPGAVVNNLPTGRKTSEQDNRRWNRNAGEAGYAYIGALTVPTSTICRQAGCPDVQKQLAETAAQRGADLLDIRGFRYSLRSKVKTTQGKCLQYGGYKTIREYRCPNVGGASCRYVDRRVRQCVRYETNYAGSDREYFTMGGSVGLWRKEPALVAKRAKESTALKKTGEAVARRWAANVSRGLTGHRASVTSLAWSPDGRFLVSGSDDKTVRIWNTASGKTARRLMSPKCSSASCVGSYVALSPDGRLIAIVAGGTTVDIRDAASGKVVRSLKGGRETIRKVAWSPDGRFLATGTYRTGRIWNAADGQLIRTLTGHTGWISSVAWSPNGRFLASGSTDDTVRIWDAVSWKLAHRLTHFPFSVTSVAWSPDGRFLAVGSSKSVFMWDATTHKLVRNSTAHTNTVDAVAWSPNGKILASGSTFTDHKYSRDTVRLWTAAGLSPLTSAGWPSNGVKTLVWSPNGRFLAVGLKNGKIDILNVARAMKRRPTAAAPPKTPARSAGVDRQMPTPAGRRER